jgi:predicted permease
VAIESEWGRIVLETGLVGLAAWIAFLIWAFTRPHPKRDDGASLAFRLAWFLCLTFFATGFIGIGLFTSIPSTAILLILVGWMASHHTQESEARVRRKRVQCVPAPTQLWKLPTTVSR